jgi:uncharacterized NAD-dependent epimerase/dehydratase family protein
MSRRFLILTQGQTHPTPAKMAAGILRYRCEEVVALLDSEQAGRDAGELMGVGHGIPIVASLEQALPLKPDTLLIGITPAGGQLPSEWRAIILQAIDHGLNVVSGMHTFLSEDEEFVRHAKAANAQLVDLRRPPDDLTVNKCRAQETNTFRIHTVGTDCNCGKKVTAIEVDRALREIGKNSTFIATGQTGILISGKGIALDRVISDFVSGAAERLVLENAGYDYLVIEGQGAITHPLYSGVTLSMLHGFAPQALILCHQADRTIMRGTSKTAIPPIEKLIDLYERIAEPVFPTKVIAVGVNTSALSDAEARRQVERIRSSTGLPAADVIRFEVDKLVQAALDFEQQWRSKRPSAIPL